MLRSRLPWILVALLLLASVPPAHGHGQSEAAELEWYVLEDEADDSVYASGGWDVYQVFVGEAYDPETGGNGVYFRTVLFGDPTAGLPEGGTLSATFEFTAGGESVARTLSTPDGEVFEGDFDALRVDPGDGEVEVYAFVLGEPLNLTAGSVIGDFRVTTAYGGDPRDVAPGGLYAPGSGGAVEIPFESRGRLVDAVTLEGPGKYLTVDVRDLGEGGFLLTAQSALEEGGQHAMVVVDNATSGWNVTASGPLSASLEAGGSAKFGLTLETVAPAGATVEPLRVDVLTDVGGRVTLFAVHAEDGVHLVHEEALSTLESAPIPEAVKEAPAGSPALALALLGVLALVRRRQ